MNVSNEEDIVLNRYKEMQQAMVDREIKEEIGKDIEIIGYVCTIENFFEMEGKKYHEIMIVHSSK